MRLPTLSIHLLDRIYACSTIPWRVILAEGDRTERAARHLVALGLIRVSKFPERNVFLTKLGRHEVYRRRYAFV